MDSLFSNPVVLKYVVIAMISLVGVAYKQNDKGKKVPKTPKPKKKSKDDLWIEQINTGFDEWFEELRKRK